MPNKEAVDKILTMLLVNCNSNITLMQAADILRKNPVNPFSNANKNLMNLENYNPEGSRTESELAKLQARMEETLEGLKQEKNFLEKEILKEKSRFEHGSAGSADFIGESESEKQKQRQKDQEQQKKERIEQEGLKIGTININSLDIKLKYGIGFGLLLLCAGVIYWFMKELSVNKDRSGKKSK